MLLKGIIDISEDTSACGEYSSLGAVPAISVKQKISESLKNKPQLEILQVITTELQNIGIKTPPRELTEGFYHRAVADIEKDRYWGGTINSAQEKGKLEYTVKVFKNKLEEDVLDWIFRKYKILPTNYRPGFVNLTVEQLESFRSFLIKALEIRKKKAESPDYADKELKHNFEFSELASSSDDYRRAVNVFALDKCKITSSDKIRGFYEILRYGLKYQFDLYVTYDKDKMAEMISNLGNPDAKICPMYYLICFSSPEEIKSVLKRVEDDIANYPPKLPSTETEHKRSNKTRQANISKGEILEFGSKGTSNEQKHLQKKEKR